MSASAQEPRAYGVGRVLLRGRIWWIQYSVRGERYRESSGSESRQDAVRLLKRRLAEAETGNAVSARAERVTLLELEAALARHYQRESRRSGRRATQAFANLKAAFGTTPVLRLSTNDLEDYADRRRADASAWPSGKAASIATVRYELAILRKAWRLLLAAKQLPTMPAFPTLRVNNARQGFFEEEQFRAVLAHLRDPMVRDFMEFCYLTGWRNRSEVMPLTWDRVDFAAGVVRLEVGSTKNEDGRSFPIDVLPALKALLQRRLLETKRTRLALGGADIPWVFHRDGRPLKDCYDAWRRACALAGLAGKLPHDFRRTAVRNLERAGVSQSVAMKLTGHKTAEVYRRYAIVAESDLRDGVRKLAALQRGEATG